MTPSRPEDLDPSALREPRPRAVAGSMATVLPYQVHVLYPRGIPDLTF